MKEIKYETVAVEPQIKEEIKKISQKYGKKIYVIIAEALAEYKKNLV